MPHTKESEYHAGHVQSQKAHNILKIWIDITNAVLVVECIGQQEYGVNTVMRMAVKNPSIGVIAGRYYTVISTLQLFS